MSTSRPSDAPTALLWGEQWWIPGTSGPLGFSGLAHAAEILAAHFGEPVRLRLIYQPTFLQTVAVACPKGNRATLAAALAAEFPALASADHAWGYEPILPQGDGFTTLLHFEREPGLFTLVAELAGRGVAVDSVWPLATFLHALPEEWSESGAVTVLAVQPEGACAYRHADDGHRSVPVWCGNTAVLDAVVWIDGIYARNPTERALIIADDETAATLDAHVRMDEPPNEPSLTVNEALGCRVVLPRHHPAQLLPPRPVVTPQLAAVAASILFLAFATWSGVTYARDCFAWRTEGAARESQKQALRAELSAKRANAEEITLRRAALASAAAHPPSAALLQRLSATVSPEIAVDTVQVTARGYSVSGHVAPTAPPNAWEAWRARFRDPAWTIDARPVPTRDGAFTLAGLFPP